MKASLGVCCLSIAVASSSIVLGQVSPSAGYGGIGDPAGAPGSPQSSYALGSIDHVNYYNGSVNFTLPLLTIGGRGTVSRNIVTPVQRQWEADLIGGSYAPSPTQAQAFEGGSYTSGYLQFFTKSQNTSYCQTNGNFAGYLGPLVTYGVWTAYDGTQTILTDTKYNGQPLDSTLQSCSQLATYSYADRGKIFRSTDGTDLTFIANADVMDGTDTPPPGALIMRDGTRFTFSLDGYVQQIEDRNGNRIVFSFQSTASGGIYTASDPNGRNTLINFTEDPASDPQDVLTYPSFNGSTQTVKVNYSLLQNSLANGESIEAYNCLFPELAGATSNLYNPYVVSSVQLPDNTSYTLKYNSYGEVTQATMPTGGYYKYKYLEAGSSCAANGNSGVITLQNNSGYRILRRLQERDEYTQAGTLTAKIVFSTAVGNVDGQHSNRPTTAVTVSFQNTGGTVLRQEVHWYYGNPASNASDPANPAQFADWWLGLELQSTVGSSTLVNQYVQNVYQQRPLSPNEPDWFGDPQADTAPPHDEQLCQVDTTINTIVGGGMLSGLIYQYDQYNNLTDKYEYDFGSTTAVAASCPTPGSNFARHTHSQFLTTNSIGDYTAANILTLPTLTSVAGPSGTLATETLYSYDNNPVSNAPSIVGHDNTKFAGGGVRGNATTVSQCINAPTCNSFAANGFYYDIAGNVVKIADPNNNATTYTYGDPKNTYANPTTIKDALQNTTTAVYDYNTGKITSQTDPNSATTTWAYNDPFGRLTSSQLPNGQSTTYTYTPTLITVAQDQNTNGDGALQSRIIKDSWGRATESDVLESSSQYIATTQQYDALGNVASTTNPSRYTNGTSDGLGYPTSYFYDPLGRVTQVQTPDGAIATNAYSGNTVIKTDPVGKKQQITNDALGRTTGVIEDPSGLNISTSYLYDALSNLTKVTQGSQTRTFVYDGRSLLLSAANPESGTTTYSYDSAGNLTSRTNGNSVTTTLGPYDALNRLKQKVYTDGTPKVTYSYDAGGAIAHATGHLTSVSTSQSVTNFTSFDPLGNVLASNQVTASNTYTFAYTYNLTGALATLTYPHGGVLTTTYDTANRPNSATGSLPPHTTTYASQALYWPHGGIYYYQRGNGLVHAEGYNNRLQLSEMYEALNTGVNNTLLVDCLNWGVQPNYGSALFADCPVTTSTQDNGTLRSSIYKVGGPGMSQFQNFNQTYTHDNLNRLTAMNDNGWSRSFNYDQYGNMWVPTSQNTGGPISGGTPQSNIFNASTNRRSDLAYDNAGNQKVVNGAQATYDAENRQISTIEPPALGSVVQNYIYDGNGKLVEKTSGSSVTVYVYDAMGVLQAEYTNASSINSPCLTPCYLGHDYLGSLRLVTDRYANIVGRHDYIPYGEEIPAGTAGRTTQWGATKDTIPTRFTGQLRDPQTNLDWFNTRYFEAAAGRFLSPDPANAGADITHPQSWNAYAYVLGNPLANVDPSGLDCVTFDNGATGDDGQGTACPGSQTSQTITVNDGGDSSLNGVDTFSGGGTSGARAPSSVFTTVAFGKQYVPTVATPPNNGNANSCPGAMAQQLYKAALYASAPDSMFLASKAAVKSKGTAFFGFSASAAAGFPGLPSVSRALSGQAVIGVDAKGNIGLLLSGSIGLGAGDGLAAGVDVGLSRASTIYDMAGPSFSVGFGGGNGIGGAVQVSNNGGGTATGTVGFGVGGFGFGGTYGPTKVIPLVCR